MDIALANRNYYDKEFYNITEFDKLITNNNQNDQEAKKFFATYPTIMGIYVSSNHVNVYIILFDGNIRLPSKVDVKEERNMRDNDDKLKRKYVIKPCHEEKFVLTFYEKKLKNFPVDVVFLATNLRIGSNYVSNRFCYDGQSVKQKLSIVYCFSKNDFMAQWNSVVLRSKRDKSYAHEFYFPFRYNSDYPKINVILDIKNSPIRYYTDDEYELPNDDDKLVTSESDNADADATTDDDDNDNDKQLITPLIPPTDVISSRLNTPTMASVSGLEFTPIPKRTTYANLMQSIKARVQQQPSTQKPSTSLNTQKPSTSLNTQKPSTRKSYQKPVRQSSSLFPKNNKKQDDDGDPQIFT